MAPLNLAGLYFLLSVCQQPGNVDNLACRATVSMTSWQEEMELSRRSGNETQMHRMTSEGVRRRLDLVKVETDANGQTVVLEDIPDSEIMDGDSSIPWDHDYMGTADESMAFRELDDGSVLVDLARIGRIKGFKPEWEDEETEENYVLKFPRPPDEMYFVDYQMTSNVFLYKNQYTFQIRYKTDADQPNPLNITLFRNETVEVSHTIPLPSTQGEWGVTEPLRLGALVGGEATSSELKNKVTRETVVRISHKGEVSGEMGVWVDELYFKPVAPSPNVDIYSDHWMAYWYQSLKTKIRTEIVPQLDEGIVEEVISSFANELDVTIPAAEKMFKNSNPSKQEIYDDHHGLILEAQNETMKVALPLLESLDTPLQTLFEEHHQILIRFMVLQDRSMALYSQHGGVEAKKAIFNILSDENMPLLKLMMINGVPEGGDHGDSRTFDYIKAVSLYNEIQGISVANAHEYRALRKLAVAVAIELSTPLQKNSDVGNFVDPLARYKHYEQAYLDGLLDSAFEYFTIWEMRLVINGNFPDEELTWARQALLQFKPEAAYEFTSNRYSIFNVKYRTPSWISHPITMQQALAGGGLCGIQAQFARLMCQAFGLPVWGVQQPQHAAYNRWTEDYGWGLGFTKKPYEVSYWKTRNALDSRMEIEFRQRFGDEAYTSQVSVLEYIARAMNEQNYNVRTSQHASTDPDALWFSLAVLQRRRFYPLGWKKKERVDELEVISHIENFIQRVDVTQENFQIHANGDMVLPGAKMTLGYKGPKQKARVVKSYAGGQQVILTAKTKDFELHYQISPEVAWAERKNYLMSIKLATTKPVDLSNRTYEAPMTVQVTSDYNDNGSWVRNVAEYEIPVPYTESLFQMTDPIEVELGGGLENFVLTLPPHTDQVLAVKEILLKPADSTYGFLEPPGSIPLEIPFFPDKRGEIITDNTTGVTRIPAAQKNFDDFNLLGANNGFSLFDSVYSDTNVQAYLPDKVTGLLVHAKDSLAGLNTTRFALTMLYSTRYPPGVAAGPDNPIVVKMSAAGLEDLLLEVNDTNGIMTETAPVIIDIAGGSYWRLSRDAGCKAAIIFKELRLTPIYDDIQ